MFTKVVRIILAAVLIGSLGCSKEDVPFRTVPKVKASSVDCLSKVGASVDKFFVGSMSELELLEFWTCVDKSVQLFSRYVRGEKLGVFSPREIYNFLTEYFFRSLSVPSTKVDSLLVELMQIKRILVGGSAKSVTMAEIGKLRQWVQILKKQSLLLRPHMRVLSASESLHNRPSLGSFQLATRRLSKVGQAIGAQMGKENQRYTFSSLKSLLIKFDEIKGIKNSKRQGVARWFPFIIHSKQMLVGPSKDWIQPTEWQNLMRVAIEIYESYLNWHYFVRPSEEISDPLVVSAIERMAIKVLGLLEQSLSWHKDRSISNFEILQLLTDLETLEVLPKSFPAKEAAISWLVINGRILNTNFDRGQEWVTLRDHWLKDQDKKWEEAVEGLYQAVVQQPDKIFSGFGQQAIKIVRKELKGWLSVQRRLASQSQQKQKFYGLCDQRVDTPWMEMTCVASSEWPLALDAKGRLVFERGRSGYDLYSLSTLNWERGATRLIVNGYGDVLDENGRKNGISKAVLESLFFDFKPFLVRMGLVSPDNFNFFVRVFSEGNLFVARSDGDLASLSFLEGVDYIHYALAGVKAGGFLVDLLKKQCQVFYESGVEKIAVDCFRWHFRKTFSQYVGHIPKAVEFVEGLNDKQWSKYERQLEVTIRAENDSMEPISTSDIREIFVLLQYQETFIFRFDQNHSETVNYHESGKALPIYMSTLAELLGFDPVGQKWELEVMFTYLLKFGESPFREDPIAGLEYLHWKWHPENWIYEANRLDLAQILASLSLLQ